MIHHPGEVLAVFRPGDSDVKSSDSDILATVRMWDDNILTLVVDSTISGEIREGDKVLVDYRPQKLSPNSKTVVQKQLVTKIIKGSRAERIWSEYRKWYNAKKQQATQMASDYMG